MCLVALLRRELERFGYYGVAVHHEFFGHRRFVLVFDDKIAPDDVFLTLGKVRALNRVSDLDVSCSACDIRLRSVFFRCRVDIRIIYGLLFVFPVMVCDDFSVLGFEVLENDDRLAREH